MQFLTPDELCKLYKIKKQKLYKMTSCGRVPFLKVGNELRFNSEEVVKAFKVKIDSRKVIA